MSSSTPTRAWGRSDGDGEAYLYTKARSITGVEGWPFRAVVGAMEVMYRTLVRNAAGNAIRVGA